MHLTLGFENSPPVLLFSGISTRLEISEWLGIEGELTELKNMRFGGELLDSLILVQKGLSAHLGFVGIFHPVDGEEITKARVDGFTIDLVVWRAVGTPRRFFGVGSSDGVDVQVVLENVLEHGSRLASLDVDDHFFVHLVLVHEFEGFMELIGVKVSTGWHSNETWGTVVSKVEENLGVFVRFENWSIGGGGITLKDVDDVGGGSLSSLIVDLTSGIDILTWSSLCGWLVENLTWEWVFSAVGNIIVGKMDDLVLWDTVLLQDLVSVAGISLMSVVAVCV